MVRNAFKGIIRFSRLLRHPPVEQSHSATSRETARRLRHAIGMSCSSAYGSGGNRNIDGLLTKEFADGQDRVRTES